MSVRVNTPLFSRASGARAKEIQVLKQDPLQH